MAVKASNLGKYYRIYDRPADMLKELMRGKSHHIERWALRDVSFELPRGNVMGVIGANGAGKSTLLKILSGTLERSTGSFEMNGRLSALLELGTGFNPQYTGRQNIMMGGLCLGMTADEVRTKEDWIIDFSELADVIDHPFKTYSSGMQARLTFATAISVDPEIFIVDEALATGDARFVEKCLKRIEEIVRGNSTVIFVSHNINMVIRFCTTAIWIEKGEIAHRGLPSEVCKYYEAHIYENHINQAQQAKEPTVIGDQNMVVKDVRIIGDRHRRGGYQWGKELIFELLIDSKIDSKTANFWLQIAKLDGTPMWSGSNYHHINESLNVAETQLHISPGQHRVQLRLPAMLLNPGPYQINVGIEPYPDVATTSAYHDYQPRIKQFTLMRDDIILVTRAVDLPSSWAVVR